MPRLKRKQANQIHSTNRVRVLSDPSAWGSERRASIKLREVSRWHDFGCWFRIRCRLFSRFPCGLVGRRSDSRRVQWRWRGVILWGRLQCCVASLRYVVFMRRARLNVEKVGRGNRELEKSRVGEIESWRNRKLEVSVLWAIRELWIDRGGEMDFVMLVVYGRTRRGERSLLWVIFSSATSKGFCGKALDHTII